MNATNGNLAPVPLSSRIRTSNSEVERIVQYALQVASTPYSVLIEGETGTGKEVFARGIHEASKRSGPFVPVNCSAVPESMFEAELFGARRGAYTGLDKERPGLFSLANGGTLFLDEIGDLPESMQAKLLRVLEDGVLRPLGGTESVRVDVRVVAATHKRLLNLVEAGKFRSDLFFRLSAASLRLPPIRERPEDIVELARDAVEEASRLQGAGVPELTPETLRAIRTYPWPGNIRELKNVMAQAVLNCDGQYIRLGDLPARVSDTEWLRTNPPSAAATRPFFDALTEFERHYFNDLMSRAEGNISRASRISGLSRSSVRDKARSYGLLDGPPAHPGRPRQRVRKPRIR